MSIIDKVVDHYESLEQTVIPVPEWETVLYFNPITVKTMGRTVQKLEKGDVTAMVGFIVSFALTEDGGKAFDLKDKPLMIRKATIDILDRIITAVMDLPEEKDVEKN